MPFTSAQLRAELDGDPAGLGYQALVAAGDDVGLAAALNLVRAPGTFQVNREPITREVFFKNIDAAEYLGRTQLQAIQLNGVLSVDAIDLWDATTIAILQGLFPAGGLTRTALTNLRKRQGSRAEVLWGTSTLVTPKDVAAAYGRT